MPELEIDAANPAKVDIPDVMPIFTPEDLVFFPGIILPLAVSDEDTIEMVNEVMQGKGPRIMGAFLQKSKPGEKKERRKSKSERAEEKEGKKKLPFYRIGTAVMILRMLRMPDGSIRMIVQGLERIELEEVIRDEAYMRGRVKTLRSKPRRTTHNEALVRALREDFEEMAELSTNIPDEYKTAVENISDPGSLADLIASNLNIDAHQRQAVLEAIRMPERIRLVRNMLAREIQILRIGSKIQTETTEEIEKSRREYFLRQQLKQIKKELGEGEDSSPEIKEWQEKIEKADLPEHVLEVAEKEMDRLERINPASAEYTVVTTYLDWLVSLPWKVMTEDHLDLKEAKEILDEDHYGLKDIKERILEVLAVRKLKPDSQGPILCLVGPPGVGKTSLGKSIARAMGRKFVRVSLGGVRDEAEIRGHRRTYVGAMPGRMIQSLKKAGSSNPVFMLDEIDKLVSDFRGDPSSALLEVLDPAQNDSFSDHYLEVEYDLSSVFFITTANYQEAIPPPLLDRMEVIRLPGYIANEKVEIAKHYLVPRQIEANGLTKSQVRFTDKALDDIVTYYTREAGVRNLERTIGSVCRKVARKVAENLDKKGKKVKGSSQAVVKHGNLRDYLGPEKITPDWMDRTALVGVVNGLAYTPYGGSVLKIETAMMPGKGGLKITGRLGDVMKESAQIGLSWIRAHAKKQGIEAKLLDKHDIHLHVPEGATPKDGPSAGITMCAALSSLFSGRKVRSDFAMTGEITLFGHVLPIGGLREKVVAANRARIEHIIIPWENRKDLEKIPEEVRKAVTFYPVKTIEQVLELVLMGEPKKVSENSSSKNSKKKDTNQETVEA
ncbi:endopeptidase La [bacterium]|nr:endopeptidase La [bacterium]